jgi:nucleoredoxin
MSGNVYEWVWDINIPTHGIQGGSYMSGKWHLILNHRNSSPLRDFANEVGSARSLGFRVARNHSKETKPPITPVSYQTIPDHSASGPEQPTVPKVDLLSLIGKELINAAGEPVDPNTLQNKMIALYFSAHWCGPCQGFTPKLVDLANKHKDDLTVVFLSSDKSAEAMLTYMNESKMPWPAIPFESENIQKLKDVLKVKSIPTLVILNPSGNLLTADGRNDVGKLTPEKCIAKWKSSQPLELSKLSKIQAPPIFQRSPPPRPKDITIDPGKSIFGCAYGSSEDDVINKLGTPLGRSEFESGVTGLIYGIDCLLYLKNGGLVGASLNHDSNYAILNRFSYSSPQQYFNNISTGGWRLSNGIHPKMAFQDAKKILGSQIALNEANPQFEINNQVIMFSSSNRNNFHLIESLTILPKELKEGIKLKQQSSELEITTINPGRIFLGCKWGSGPQEIIQTLGNPNAIFDLGENKKGYSYKNNLLILWDEKLAGCHLTNPGSLTLPNGVRLGMPLQEAITIIGDKLIEPKKNNFSEISYTDGSLLFTVKSIKMYKPGDWSRIFEGQQNPQSFVVGSIQIDPIAKSIN